MMRLLTQTRWNIVIQFRYGFYYVSFFFALICIAILRQIPYGEILTIIVSGFMAANLIIVYYYIGSLVLFEKGERTLAGLMTSPLQPGEYILAKVCSLVLLTVLESTAIGILGYGLDFNLLLVLIGLILLSTLYTLIGFIAVINYDSLNEYLLPSSLGIVLVLLPLIDFLGLWHSPIFYLHPAQPALVLVRSAFTTIHLWEFVYGILGALFWCLVSFWIARNLLHRFVIRSVG